MREYLLVSRFPDKLAHVPNDILQNSPFRSFDSFSIVSIAPFSMNQILQKS